MRNNRIGRPPAAMPEVAKPSPLAGFVDWLHSTDAQRAMLADFGHINDKMAGGAWLTFLEDLHMMLHERLVVGIRSPWLRRVATPVLMAHRHITEAFQHPDEPKRALETIEILRQCQDDHVRDACITWVRESFHV
jgi:hypothetical protein